MVQFNCFLKSVEFLIILVLKPIPLVVSFNTLNGLGSYEFKKELNSYSAILKTIKEFKLNK